MKNYILEYFVSEVDYLFLFKYHCKDNKMTGYTIKIFYLFYIKYWFGIKIKNYRASIKIHTSKINFIKTIS